MNGGTTSSNQADLSDVELRKLNKFARPPNRNSNCLATPRSTTHTGLPAHPDAGAPMKHILPSLAFSLCTLLVLSLTGCQTDSPFPGFGKGVGASQPTMPLETSKLLPNVPQMLPTPDMPKLSTGS